MAENEPQPLILDPAQWSESPGPIVDAVLGQPGQDIIIEGSQSGAITAQVAQLLLAFQTQAKTHDKSFRIDNISDAARSSLTHLGLSHQLLESQT